MPKRLDFGSDDAEGTDNTRSPKRLSLPTNAEPEAPKAERKPRALGLPTTPPPPPEEPKTPERKPRTLDIQNGELTHERKERPRTQTDYLVERAVDKSPDIDPARVRGRIDMLLKANSELLIQWGEVNLAPLQQASTIQANIANEMQRIDAVNCLNEAKDAVCGNAKGFFDRFSQKKPEHYEFRLKNAKRELTLLMVQSEQQRRSFSPEVHDLHLDSIALTVVLPEYNDAVLMNIANSRTKTLLLAHQTGTMLLTVLENTVQQCAQFIEQIDSMLSVTIPQWKMAQKP